MNPRFMRYKDELHWGRVGKGCDDGNEIELDPDLVRVVEAAPEGSDLLVYMMLILVTIFHELMHHLTKSVFNRQLTPPNGLIVGEVGRELEEKIFAGVVCAIWDKGETAEMEKIRCLVLDYRGALKNLPINKCRLLIESVSTSQIAKFQYSKLEAHITKQGSELHRIASPIIRTEPYPPPGMVITHRCRGLGINNMDNIIADDEHIKYVAYQRHQNQ
ncbi:hypothetical protein PILCRDRAFT_827891 [Piloderma croceum F 1598]|uniref:Uncharacterized protein n=1 Tax=Piloderma croceum (strain F 1598) TaxID=765440 RepID=A0A0C3ALQ6_PILCF|nr:hypothetical protein PILCRDRAFT_827891 [Piloderma croceum F 1598]